MLSVAEAKVNIANYFNIPVKFVCLADIWRHETVHKYNVQTKDIDENAFGLSGYYESLFTDVYVFDKYDRESFNAFISKEVEPTIKNLILCVINDGFELEENTEELVDVFYKKNDISFFITLIKCIQYAITDNITKKILTYNCNYNNLKEEKEDLSYYDKLLSRLENLHTHTNKKRDLRRIVSNLLGYAASISFDRDLVADMFVDEFLTNNNDILKYFYYKEFSISKDDTHKIVGIYRTNIFDIEYRNMEYGCGDNQLSYAY